MDAYYHERRAAGRAAKLRVGAYHYARPDLHGPVEEAAHFCTVVGALARGHELRPALDFEQGAPVPEWAKWARDWCRAVHMRLGVWPLFYSYPAYIAGLRIEGGPIGGGLWIASVRRDWTGEPSDPFRVPAPWRKAYAHQYSWRGHVAGVEGDCDLSVLLEPAAVLL